MRQEIALAIIVAAIFALIWVQIAWAQFRNYLVRPLRLRFRSKGFDAAREFVAFDPADMPEPARQALSQVSRQLAGSGFRAIDHVRPTRVHEEGDATAYVSLWRRDEGDDVAMVIILAWPNRSKVRRSVSVAVDFVDESALSVSDAKEPRPILQHPGTRTIRLPEIWDPATLWEVERRWVERDRSTRAAQVIKPGQGAEYMAKQNRAWIELLAAHGWLRLNPQDGLYYYTLRGAFLTIWGQLWPLKHWRERRDKREAEQLIRSLGFDGVNDLIRRQRPIIHDEAGGASIPVVGSPVLTALPVGAVTPEAKPAE